MFQYNLDPEVEAFSTSITDPLDFDVVLPELQAHGTKCAIITADNLHPDTYGVDAIITDVPGMRIGVKTADCVPVLIYCKDKKVVAAIHSGWKGTLAGIIPATIEKLKNLFGADPKEMLAIIGPSISQEAYEVGDELYEAFCRAGYSFATARMPRFGTADHIKWHISVADVCLRQLRDAGAVHISADPHCTYRHHDLFYSSRYLKDKLGAHRIINSIKLEVGN